MAVAVATVVGELDAKVTVPLTEIVGAEEAETSVVASCRRANELVTSSEGTTDEVIVMGSMKTEEVTGLHDLSS